MTRAATEEIVARDKRIDLIGFVDELKKHFADDKRSAVKISMGDKDVTRAHGDYFEAVLSGGTSRVIDPAKYVKLYESKKITRAEFISALSVGVKAAGEFLNPGIISKISDEKEISETLRISRRDGVSIELVDALKGLTDAIATVQA